MVTSDDLNMVGKLANKIAFMATEIVEGRGEVHSYTLENLATEAERLRILAGSLLSKVEAA